MRARAPEATARPSSAPAAAGMLLGALEGGMLMARAYGDPSRFEPATRLVLGQFESPGASVASTRHASARGRHASARTRTGTAARTARAKRR